ncbi:MAG: YkgJ family cysteine cluster protein [Campylobacterales bacterium]|nr:YkgJ family cysteine cluster protein [Campylobacterales bacterium]
MMIKEGFNFSFNPTKCEECGGKCCKGESGNIWVDEKEIESIANFLNVTEEALEKGCLKSISGKFSIKDIQVKSERVCFFFDLEKQNCSIYDVRPTQCRTFPFWENVKNNRKYLEDECPAIVF